MFVKCHTDVMLLMKRDDSGYRHKGEVAIVITQVCIREPRR